nr:MAG TPA: hypothetical protein [Caudoviricetes sp.]
MLRSSHISILTFAHISYMDDTWVVFFAYLHCILVNFACVIASDRYSCSLKC